MLQGNIQTILEELTQLRERLYSQRSLPTELVKSLRNDILAKSKDVLSEKLIKELHAIILQGIDQSNAGVYRKHHVMISGASHTPSSHIEIPQ